MQFKSILVEDNDSFALNNQFLGSGDAMAMPWYQQS